MRHLAFGLAAALAVVTLATPAAAQVSYEYLGNPYDHADPPWTTSMRVTGSLVLPSPLPPGTTTDVSGDLIAFSFFDGVFTRTEADSQICTAELTTDIAGDIVQWRLWFVQDPVPSGDQQHGIESVNEGPTRVDQAALYFAPTGCVGGAAIEFAAINDPGTWTEVTAPAGPTGIPTSSELGLALLALLLAAFGVWRIRF